VKLRLPGSFRDAASFRARLAELALDVDVAEPADGRFEHLAGSYEWAPGRRAANRFAVHPMEGWDGTPEGAPSDLTLRRWRRFGRSGAALVWGGEAFAVRADGRANPRQLYLRDDRAATAQGLSTLRAEVLRGREEIDAPADLGPIGLQLTHSGRWSRPEGPPAPRPATRDAILDRRAGGDEALLSDDELRAIRDLYAESAVLAADAGFDFVDVKACHGYLMHELLGARGRTGSPYGGAAIEDRARLLVETIEAVQRAAPGLAVGVRVSLADVVPHRPAEADRRGEPEAARWDHGFELLEPGGTPEHDLGPDARALLAMLAERGVRMVNVTLGSPYYNPHLQRPAAYPPSDGYQPHEDPLVSVARHLAVTRAAKRAARDMVFVGTGYTYLMDWLPHVAEAEVARGGVDAVGLGRMVLSYPELPRDVLRGAPLARKLVCRTFSDCTTAPRNGIVSGCFPLDPAYRGMPERERLEEIKRAMKARSGGGDA